MKVIAKNSKALFNYEILESLEVGIALTGSEVKSIRKGEVNLTGSYITIDHLGRMILREAHIKEYFQASYQNHDAKRPRYLLAHKKQISKFIGALKAKGQTLIPIEIYFSGKLIKLKIGLARGKKLYDKRESIKEREAKRQVAAAMKHRLP